MNQTGLTELFTGAARIALNSQQSRSSGGLGGSAGGLRSSLSGLGKQGIKRDIAEVVKALAPDDTSYGVSISDRMFKAKVDIKVGDASIPRSSLRFFYEKEFDSTSDGDVEISLSFTVKDSVDPFELGELSGSVKQILGLAQNPEFKYDIKSALSMEGDGTQVYTLIMVWHEPDAVEAAHKVVAYYDPRHFEMKLDFNKEPTVASTEFLALNLSIDCEMSRNCIRFLESALGEGKTESDRRILSLMRASRNFVFETSFDDLQELVAKASGERDLPEELKDFGWATIGHIIRNPSKSPMINFLTNPSTPEPARTTYEKLSLLKGLRGAKFKAGQHALKIETSHYDIFSLLPSMQELTASTQGKLE